MSDERDEKNNDKDIISELTDSSELVEDQEEQEDQEDVLSYEELKEENTILSDKMMRALAETENIRKKFFKEKKDAEIYGGTKLARDLLTVLDNLERALESIDDSLREENPAFVEGIELTKRELLNTFSNHEINEVKPQIGERFDPKIHQAMFEAPAPNIEKGMIFQVMTNGFTIGDRLLRAAQVGVSSKSLVEDEAKPEKTQWKDFKWGFLTRK